MYNPDKTAMKTRPRQLRVTRVYNSSKITTEVVAAAGVGWRSDQKQLRPGICNWPPVNASRKSNLRLKAS